MIYRFFIIVLLILPLTLMSQTKKGINDKTNSIEGCFILFYGEMYFFEVNKTQDNSLIHFAIKDTGYVVGNAPSEFFDSPSKLYGKLYNKVGEEYIDTTVLIEYKFLRISKDRMSYMKGSQEVLKIGFDYKGSSISFLYFKDRALNIRSQEK